MDKINPGVLDGSHHLWSSFQEGFLGTQGLWEGDRVSPAAISLSWFSGFHVQGEDLGIDPVLFASSPWPGPLATLMPDQRLSLVHKGWTPSAPPCLPGGPMPTPRCRVLEIDPSVPGNFRGWGSRKEVLEGRKVEGSSASPDWWQGGLLLPDLARCQGYPPSSPPPLDLGWRYQASQPQRYKLTGPRL